MTGKKGVQSRENGKKSDWGDGTAGISGYQKVVRMKKKGRWTKGATDPTGIMVFWKGGKTPLKPEKAAVRVQKKKRRQKEEIVLRGEGTRSGGGALPTKMRKNIDMFPGKGGADFKRGEKIQKRVSDVMVPTLGREKREQLWGGASKQQQK